ncbi:unnamed protein product [Closterium sp. Naga37s-1]|nr:unnamed protein product [Closterium sp. Naga37s-1]
MTLEWLEGRLVDAEWDRATKNSSLPADGAYVVQPGPSKPHSSTSTTSCHYCKAAGHAITNCPQLEKKKRRQQLQQQHQSPYLPQSTYQPQSQPYQPQQPQQMPFRSLAQSSPNKAAAHTALPPLAYPAHLAQPLLPSPTSDVTSPALAASHLSSTPLSSSIDSRYADVTAAHLLPTSWLPSLPSLLLLISFLLCLFSILLQRPLASVLTSSPSSSSWLLDSGASSHLCNDPHLFSSLRQPFPGSGVRFGGGEQYPAHGIGDILVYARHNNHTHPITLRDVLYIPQTVHNIISVRKLKDEGLTTHFPLHAPAQVFRGSTPFTLPTSLQKPASTPTSSPLLFPPLPTPTAQDFQLNFSDPSVNTILDEDRESAHFFHDFAYIALHSHYEPPTITAARSCPAAPQWLAAADAEITALLANRTYSILPKPPDCTPIPCKWVFKV